MREKLGAADFLRLGLEHIDEQLADGLSLLLRVLDAFERLEEHVGRVDMHQRDIVMIAKQLRDLLAFVEPQQAVIDEHAGQLRADRLMQQHGGDG